MNHNRLSGQIPAEMSNLDNLVDAGLDFNQLEGPIPSWLGDLANLEWMSLGSNSLDGPIPPELGNLVILRFLSLVDAHLNGEIPVEIGNLNNLTVLLLNNNELTGTIPTAIECPQQSGKVVAGRKRSRSCVPAGLRNAQQNDLDELGLPDCAVPPEISSIQLRELFDEIIRKNRAERGVFGGQGTQHWIFRPGGHEKASR